MHGNRLERCLGQDLAGRVVDDAVIPIAGACRVDRGRRPGSHDTVIVTQRLRRDDAGILDQGRFIAEDDLGFPDIRDGEDRAGIDVTGRRIDARVDEMRAAVGVHIHQAVIDQAEIVRRAVDQNAKIVCFAILPFVDIEPKRAVVDEFGIILRDQRRVADIPPVQHLAFGNGRATGRENKFIAIGTARRGTGAWNNGHWRTTPSVCKSEHCNRGEGHATASVRSGPSKGRLRTSPLVSLWSLSTDARDDNRRRGFNFG